MICIHILVFFLHSACYIQDPLGYDIRPQADSFTAMGSVSLKLRSVFPELIWSNYRHSLCIIMVPGAWVIKFALPSPVGIGGIG